MGYASAMAWVLVLVVGIITAVLFRTRVLGPLHGRRAMTTAMTTVSATPKAVATRNKRIRSVVFHVLVLAVAAVILYPGVWMLMSTFKPSGDIVGNVSLWPETWTLDNYVSALGGIGGVSFWTFTLNSLILALGSVVGIVLSATAPAYAFARIQLSGARGCTSRS